MLPAGRTLRARRFAPVYLAPLGSIYDIQRAVADEATKPIYYESRIWEVRTTNSECRIGCTSAFALRQPRRSAQAGGERMTESCSRESRAES